jgi:hypothetical protein
VAAYAPSAGTSNGTVNAPPISPQDHEILRPWLRWRDASRTDRKRYESTWQISQFFAAGIQWLATEQRTGRVLEDPNARDKRGRPLDVVDVLSQYNGTVIGKLSQGDFRPELLSQYDNDEIADMYAEQLNDALAFAWDEECKADKKFLAILRTLVELGTGGVRCRVDRSSGKLIAPEWPHANGQPILDPTEAYAHVAQLQSAGMRADLRPLREAKLALEKLSAWNILPPPGIEDPDDFPYELIVRPVSLSELRMVYGQKAAGVTADRIEEMGGLAYAVQRGAPAQTGTNAPAIVSGLQDHALTYTGYRKPDNEFANGQTVVFTHDGHLLDMVEELPLQQDPWGPRSGITYFRWQILEGRFWGRAFMEPGIGPQKIRNKRSSQIDQTIDSGQNKIFIEEGSIDTSKLKGVPNEIVKVKPGATMPKSDGGIPPGAWMQADIELQDTNIQKALGLYGVGLGDNPTSVTTFGQLQLLNENETVKFGPIADDFKLNVCDVVRDMVESMKQWPADKQILIAGEQNKLRAMAFDAKKAIPAAYLVRPAEGAALLRSQGAELQKVTDIMNQAINTGLAVGPNAADWVDWYDRSIAAGKALPIPSNGRNVEQRRKAALENVVMVHTGQVLPVAPEDDATIHVQEHDEEIARLSEQAALGDPDAAQLIQVLEQHKQLHLMQAQQSAAQSQPGMPGPQAMAPPAPPGPPGLSQPGQ